MKPLRYAAVILAMLAVLAVVIQFYRESVARGFVNSALSEQGITATELSIQTLGTDYVRLSHLVLEQDDGTRYEVSGLSFPLSFPSVRPETISIERLILAPAAEEAAPPPLASLLETFLQLPVGVPNTEIAVARFTMPDAPSVENILWRSQDLRQHLEFTVQLIEVDVDVDPVDDNHHQATVNAVVDGIPDAFSSTLAIGRSDTGFAIAGMSTVDLSPWLSVLQSMGLVPRDILSLGAKLDGQIRLKLDHDETRPVSASAHLLLNGEVTADYSVDHDSGARLRANSPDPLRLGFEYPSLEWTAAIGRIDMLVGSEPVADVAVKLSGLNCQSGIQCRVHASLDAGPLELETISFDDATVSASLVIADDETTRVEISQDFVLALIGVESQSFSVASIGAMLNSPAQLTIDDDGWSIDIDRIELVLDALAGPENIIASPSLAFKSLRIRDSGATVHSDVSMLPQAATLTWRGSDMAMPGVDGAMSLRENKLTASFGLFDGEGTLSAHVDAWHDVASGDGSISVDDAALLFDASPLSNHFPRWPYVWDVVSGTINAELEMSWRIRDDGSKYDGAMKYRADELAGNYKDMVFSGLNSTLSGSLDSETGVTLLPSSITIALLDVGVPVREIKTDFSVNFSEQAVQVDGIVMSALGGQLVTDPFQFRIQAQRNDIILRPKSIQLQFMVELAEFEDIDLSGSISGVLPLAVSEGGMTITNGALKSDPPGGVIRYLPGADAQDIEVPTSDLALVTRALANFQFDSLTSDVDYMENGDLKLQMRLTGINPDLDDRQPVILNLGVQNNIPQLLRSLQATRTIEDVLERRSEN